jgi:CRP-like cAMP-binding protein
LLAALSFTQVSQDFFSMNRAKQAGSSRAGATESSMVDEDDYLHRLAAHAADFYHHAALAHAWAQGATETAWTAGLEGLARGSAEASDAVVRGDEPTLRRMWVEFAFALADHMEEVARALLAHYAHELRRAVDPCTLRFDTPDWDTTPAAPARVGATETKQASAPRDELREDLAYLSRLAVRLGSHELVEAIQVAQAMLSSPGPIAPTRVARVMVTVHERFVDLMATRAEALDAPDERNAWLQVRDTLDARFRRMVDEHAAVLDGPVDSLN